MAFDKLYLTTASAPYTPATIRGAWDDSAGAVTRALSPIKDYGGAITTVARAEANAANEYDVLLYRGVTSPLAGQIIDGTLNAIIGVDSANTSSNPHWHLHVYVTQGDSDAIRGTLLSDYREAAGVNEWPTTPQGWALVSAVALSPLAIQDGDRIVIEIGYANRNTVTTSYTGTLWYGTELNSQSVADLTVGGDETTAAGYISFSNSISDLPAESSKVSRLAVRTLSQQPNVAAKVSRLAVRTLSLHTPAAHANVSRLVVRTLSRTPASSFLPRRAHRGFVMLKKNTAGQYVFFDLVSTAGSAVTGATVTAYRALDNAAQAAATGSVTELGNGQYRFEPSQADTNGDAIGYLFTATGAVPVPMSFTTQEQMADTLLTRDWNSVPAPASRSMLNALRFLRNAWTLLGSTLSVKKEDDTTEAWTSEVSTTAGAEPITGVDPS